MVHVSGDKHAAERRFLEEVVRGAVWRESVCRSVLGSRSLSEPVDHGGDCALRPWRTPRARVSPLGFCGFFAGGLFACDLVCYEHDASRGALAFDVY